MHCFQEDVCNDGSGAGDPDTVTPEPSSIALLAGSLPFLARVMRRKLFQVRIDVRRAGRDSEAS